MTALQLAEPTIHESEQLMTKEQVCKYLQISLRKLNQLLADGEIPLTKLGRLVRIAPADLRQYITDHKQRGTA